MRYLPILFALFFAAPAWGACAFSTVWPACTVQYSTGDNLEDTRDTHQEFAYGSLPACNGAARLKVYIVNDATDSGTCDAGGGSADAECMCDGSAYVPLSGGGGGTHPIAKGDYGALSIVNGDISDQIGDRIFGTKITPALELFPGVAKYANQTLVDQGTDINTFVRPVTLHNAAMFGELEGTFGAATVAADHAGSEHHTLDNPTFTGILTLPVADDPTTDAEGEIAVDRDFWETNYDAIEFFNGVESVHIVATNDAPAHREVPMFNDGGSPGVTEWKPVATLDDNVFTETQCGGPAGSCNDMWEISNLGRAQFAGYVRADTFATCTYGSCNAHISFGDGDETRFTFSSDTAGETSSGYGYVTLDGAFESNERSVMTKLGGGGYSAIWYKNTIPTTPWFQDDTATDYQLAYLTSPDFTDVTVTDGGVDVQHSGATGILDHDAYSLNWRTTGNKSIYIGYGTGVSSTRTNNVAIGQRAGNSLGLSQENVIIGNLAGRNTVDGTGRNVYIGSGAADGNATGHSNTVIGYGAGGGAGASYTNSTMVGYNTGISLTSGANNLFFGLSSGTNVDDGGDNILFSGGTLIEGGDRNIGLGRDAISKIVDTNNNIGIGFRSGRFQTGAENTAIGIYSMNGTNGSSAGVGNVTVGNYAGYTTQGSDNLFAGYYAGYLSTGNRNIFIGQDAGRRQTTADDMFIVNNTDEASAAAELTDSLIVGTMSGTPANQTLTLNAVVTTTYDAIDKADSYWTGDGSGIPYGHMYSNSTIAVTITDATPVEIGDTWTTGQVNLVAFGASHYLTVTNAGRYKIDWSMSIAQNSPSAKIQSEQGIMVNGSVSVLGRAHRTIANSSDIGASAGTAIIDLAASDQISLYVANETTPFTDIDVEHANVTVTMVGGT